MPESPLHVVNETSTEKEKESNKEKNNKKIKTGEQVRSAPGSPRGEQVKSAPGSPGGERVGSAPGSPKKLKRKRSLSLSSSEDIHSCPQLEETVEVKSPLKIQTIFGDIDSVESSPELIIDEGEDPISQI
ncbi:hypothetical protein BgiMline_018789 [Biomphalaria glabrata]|nr:hypothetical protein BgiMline_006374 [Biomphalaria glabrata]KAI8763443.1 hypothetical protein BgiMline_006379 [Biomphalaria glabrata]KAI8763445.1 hypothetical protein BgiMline_006381 [Biomphalaria glabrata]